MNRLIFSILAVILILLSCSKKPSEVNEEALSCEESPILLDTIFLSKMSNDFLKYNGTEKLFFRNEQKEEILFESSIGPIQRYFVEGEFDLICETGDLNNYEFTREATAIKYQCEELDLEFIINQHPAKRHTGLKFMDRLSLVLTEIPKPNEDEEFVRLLIITSLRGGAENDEWFLEFPEWQRYWDNHEVTILDKEFQKVFSKIHTSSDVMTELYFSEELGLIGFKDLQSRLWVLDRIE